MGLLFIFLDPPIYYQAPQLTTNGATSVTQTSAVLNGSIIILGGELNIERGFQISTVPYPNDAPDGSVKEYGSFSAGNFSLSVDGLTPETTYYYRAYSKNTQYTGYGTWVTFTTSLHLYTIEIDGEDRTADVIIPSLQVEDQLNDQQNSCQFLLDNRRGLGFPEADEEVIITMDDGTILFGGYIVNVSINSKIGAGAVMASISCIDYARLLDSNLVHRTYENMTDKQIIESMVAEYCIGFGITTTNVLTGITIEQISFNYLQPSQCLRKICELTGRNWYIDYSKDLHYFPLATNSAPFNIDSSCASHTDLKITKDSSQIKNRVYVRGGTKLSDFTTYSEKGDGTKIKFTLPDKPHDVSITVNGAAKSIGIKNIDTTGYDWYLNYQEKYIEQDAGGSVLGAGDVLVVTYKYDIPILVAVENQASIIAHGQKEFAIFDKSIATTQAARDRATAELTDYANHIVEGSFKTLEPGFRSGQYININLTEYDVNANYIVQKVTSVSMGGGVYEYSVFIASAKTMGIIKFLIELLEANKNLVELDDNEVVDELYNLTDSLLSDSLTDSLIIDSAGPYATWCAASETSPSTRARWDLFQWG